MGTETDSAATRKLLAWALHCWGLRRICTHPAASKSSEQPGCDQLSQHDFNQPHQFTSHSCITAGYHRSHWQIAQFHATCAALSSGVQRNPPLPLFVTAATGSLHQVTIWISDGLQPIACAWNSTSILNLVTRGKLGVKCYHLGSSKTSLVAQMGQSRRLWEIRPEVVKWLEADPEGYVVYKKRTHRQEITLMLWNLFYSWHGCEIWVFLSSLQTIGKVF